MKKLILRNRYTLLLATLIAYMAILVAEGAITGREARVVEFENPFFDLNINNLEDFRERRGSRDGVGREPMDLQQDDTGDV